MNGIMAEYHSFPTYIVTLEENVDISVKIDIYFSKLSYVQKGSSFFIDHNRTRSLKI